LVSQIKARTQTEDVQDRELRRIFRSKRDKVIGSWRKLHNEKLHTLYPSPNIIRMVKSKRMK
jgi:hypothetical protein